MSNEGRRIEIQGIVQGVGFRPWVYRVAHEQGIAGSVRNDSSGVIIDAFGSRERLDRFVEKLGSPEPAAASIQTLSWKSIPANGESGFQIVGSQVGDDRRVSIPPDLATCDQCRTEIFDPTDRRFRYAFTNCTNCGPRFTIARDVPYDRAATTMAPFRMCPQCQAEYDDPLNRRFHAQPNACPACGPRLLALASDGALMESTDVVATAARAIRAQLILAIKGLGGFHLACDATSSAAVNRLRQRKHRDSKPFAVMVRDLAAAERIAVLNDEERQLLSLVERPIVLAPRRDGSPIVEEVAPLNRLVGILLPYTPLHHLLLSEAGRPLVMTSGNLSDEPIAYRNGEALERLGGIADMFVVHDREIEAPNDDSVARVIAGAPVVLRRARGWVPRASRWRGDSIARCSAAAHI